MNRAVFANATATSLFAFCLNAVALDHDLNHRNNHNNLYHHSNHDSVLNYVDRTAKRVIRTDYRKVRERVKADRIRRYGYADHHHRHYHQHAHRRIDNTPHQTSKRGEYYRFYHRHSQYHPAPLRHHRYSKAHLDSLAAIYLVDYISHYDH